jgi:hypothetical protein
MLSPAGGNGAWPIEGLGCLAPPSPNKLLVHGTVLLEDDNPLIAVVGDNHVPVPAVADSRRLQKALSHAASIFAVAQRRDAFTIRIENLNAIVAVVAHSELSIAPHCHAARPLHVSPLLASAIPDNSRAGAIQIKNSHPIVSTIRNEHTLAVWRHCDSTRIFQLPLNLPAETNDPDHLASGV